VDILRGPTDMWPQRYMHACMVFMNEFMNIIKGLPSELPYLLHHRYDNDVTIPLPSLQLLLQADE